MSAADADTLQCLVRQGKAWISKSHIPLVGALLPGSTYPRWEVTVELPDGTRKRTFGDTQREARQAMKEYLAKSLLNGKEGTNEQR